MCILTCHFQRVRHRAPFKGIFVSVFNHVSDWTESRAATVSLWITLHIKRCVICIALLGAWIAQWLERRTRDWKVAGSNPCWNGGRIFFSRVDFLCWLLIRYPFHPRVTTVARKKSRSFCQKCRLQLNTHTPYICGFYWTVLRHWSQLVPNISNDIWGH